MQNWDGIVKLKSKLLIPLIPLNTNIYIYIHIYINSVQQTICLIQHIHLL